jgi:hypothetical protein
VIPGWVVLIVVAAWFGIPLLIVSGWPMLMMALHRCPQKNVKFVGEWTSCKNYECACGKDWEVWAGSAD